MNEEGLIEKVGRDLRLRTIREFGLLTQINDGKFMKFVNNVCNNNMNFTAYLCHKADNLKLKKDVEEKSISQLINEYREFMISYKAMFDPHFRVPEIKKKEKEKGSSTLYSTMFVNLIDVIQHQLSHQYEVIIDINDFVDQLECKTKSRIEIYEILIDDLRGYFDVSIKRNLRMSLEFIIREKETSIWE